jgi:DNA helicase-2/ATP-dependent DNA helicase PcrA
MLHQTERAEIVMSSDGPAEKSFGSDYFAALNAEQRAAVVHEGSPLLILAGAGSGKTRVITTKIAYLISQKNVDPRSILAVTFTKKAAEEMAERAVNLVPEAAFAQIRTFHSFGAWFLRKYSDEAGVDSNFTVYDDDDMVTLVSKAVPSLAKNQAKHAAHVISLAKDYCLTPDSSRLSEIESDPDFPAIYTAYEKRLRQTGNVDFGDLIQLPSLVIASDERIRRQIHYRFRVILVDEYQDSNVAQFKLLQAVAGVEDNSGTYVCVVGDDDQSIYKFRGAEVKNILTFKDFFPGTTIIRLEQNYRSTAPILAVANTVVKNNQGRLGKKLVSVRGKGKQPVMVFLPNQDDESAFCAELITKAHTKGCPYNEWAVLYRMNAQSLGFETEFLHRNIPYTVVGSLKFYEREEIKDVLAFLSLIANPRDEISFRRIVNKPARGIGAKTQDRIIDAAQHENGRDGRLPSLVECAQRHSSSLSKKAREGVAGFVSLVDEFSAFLAERSADTTSADEEVAPAAREILQAAQAEPAAGQKADEEKLSVFIKKIIVKSGLLEYHTAQDEIAGTQRAANMQELVNSAVLYPCTLSGLLDFLERIELDHTLEENGNTKNSDSVTLITLHNTKGLEFPRVIITGLESGVFPRQDKTGGELEEERRLFYVGITRAQNQLYITSCRERRLYGRTEHMLPSPFLSELGDTVKILGRKPSPFRDYSGFNDSPQQSDDPLVQKWCRGTRIYHDDFGYGQIVNTVTKDDNYVITVQFENGGRKCFMPRYQAGTLMIVKD